MPDEYAIVTDPVKFRETLLSQIPGSHVDEPHGPTLRVLLYYIWRGAFKSRAAIILHHVQPDELGWLCLSTYKAFLPIIQLIRLGYPTDAFILLRALTERIALLGYLNANPRQTPRYVAGTDLKAQAMTWAKENAPQNWGWLYGILSRIAHSIGLEGPAGHILDENPIGEAFRKDLARSPGDIISLTDELLCFVIYGLVALDPIALDTLGYQDLASFPSDRDSLEYLDGTDLAQVHTWLQDWLSDVQRRIENRTQTTD